MKPKDLSEPAKKSVLDEAKEVIFGERQKDYGHPKTNLRRIAALWSIVLDKKEDITPEQVCLCLMSLKLARLIHKPDHRDSQTDMAGYAALLERILDSEDNP